MRGEKGFYFDYYLTMVSLWKSRNNKFFKNVMPNFRRSISFLKASFDQFINHDMDKNLVNDHEVTTYLSHLSADQTPPLEQ